METIKKNNLKKGTIVTYADEEEINYDGFTINIVPAINFLTTKI
jgi:predicted AAA+ superfamily ATPase